MKKHEWRTVTLEQSGYYGRPGPSLIDWLYKLEGEGWEIFSVFYEPGVSDCGEYGATILCRKEFVPAEIRRSDGDGTVSRASS